MGCPLLMFRPLASLVLGAIAFLAFFAYLFFNLVDGHILSSEFYAEALVENDAYVRLYDEVLVDPALQDEAKELLGSLEVPQEEMALVAKRIMPPEYLQGETERTLNGLIDYLNKDTDGLELYIDLAKPLENASKELVEYAERRIDRIEIVEAGSVEEMSPEEDESEGDEVSEADVSELAEQVIAQLEDSDVIRVEEIELETEEEWTAYWEETVRELQGGELPSRAPSLVGVPVRTRVDSYYAALDELRETESVPREIVEALEEPETDLAIRTALSDVEQDPIKEVLKAATGGVIPSLVDDTLDDVRRKLVTPDGVVCKGLPEGADLSRCSRYDVLALLDEDIEGSRQVNDVRDSIQIFGSLGSWLPRAVLIGACILIVVVNLPRVVSALRWLGLVLGLTGAFFLITGILVGGTIPDRLDSVVQDIIEDNDAPASVAMLASDVASSMAEVLSLSLTSPSMIMAVVGGLLFGASLFIRRVPGVRSLPFVSSLVG